jgi:hypothetical protein
MKLAALILLMPLVIVFTGLLWFASLWVRHQDGHGSPHAPSEGEAERSITRSVMTTLMPAPKEEFVRSREACR